MATLFKDRNLNIAIVISASCHLIGMLSIAPVIVSGNMKGTHGTVSFLGSILERIIAVPENSLTLEEDYFIQKLERIATANSEKVSLVSPDVGSKSRASQPDKGRFASNKDKGSAPFFGLRQSKRERPRIEFSDVFIAGEAKNRMLLYKPDLPKVIVLDSDFSLDHEVVVRFRIHQYGFIENPECLMSSGSPEIDRAAIRYIRKWQFVPLDRKRDGLQEGMVRLRFTF
ncbi:MAG: energy transducer TonB [Candidatus Omnitrophica bacterium]|nr:energy transducer TonB [Candidatus Omnitrophota bacterium]